MRFLFSLIGFVVGAIAGNYEGALVGLTLGFLVGGDISLSGRVKVLESALENLKKSVAAGGSKADATPPATELAPAAPLVAEPLIPPQPAAIAVVPTQTTDPVPPPVAPEKVVTPPYLPPEPGPIGRAINEFGASIRRFFTTGNVVAKIGIILLFFGVGFLIKYAVDRSNFPIEFRLAGIAFGGIGLLSLGWWLRLRKPALGLSMQGGAVGILYLTVFAATRLYVLLPQSLAFPLMVLLVVASGVLAVAQNSRSLAGLGAAGGFLAPVLLSTGGGSHVALFSYYALLNAGIVGVAWFKVWRILNWIGFVFTFVIAALWGHRYYQPQYFATTEPFLILFFLFYVAIAVLFSLRQPPRLRGFVDATLVFGTPLVGFVLQSELVDDYEFGQAFSALAMSAVYLVLARVLWSRQIPGIRLLTEAFLALGVIFATLAIPFALDGQWTAAAWAMEGAGMIWIGLHQQRVAPRQLGVILQVAAGVAFAIAESRPAGAIPVLNSVFIGGALIGLSSLFAACHYYRARESIRSWESGFHMLLLMWGMLWWLGIGVREIDHFLAPAWFANASLAFFTLSLLVLSVGGEKFSWDPAREFVVIQLPVLLAAVVVLFLDRREINPFADFGWIAWPLALACQYRYLLRTVEDGGPGLPRALHAGTMWLGTFVLAWAMVRFIAGIGAISAAWSNPFWGIVPAGIAALLIARSSTIPWPVADNPEAYFQIGVPPMFGAAALWVLFACFQPGDPAPLPYVPLLNPVELCQVLILLLAWYWLACVRDARIPGGDADQVKLCMAIAGMLAFMTLNAAVARGVHFFDDVRFTLSDLHHSPVFQSTIAIVWTVTAMTLTAVAARRRNRPVWFAGALLIGAVVVKLFLVDLKDTNTIARIVSFMTVGILLLAMGYFSPLPPREQEAR